MTKWIPLHLHSHFSLLDGLSKPKQIASVCSEHGFSSCALTDHGSISGAVSFSKAVRDKGIKPILGCELYTSRLSAKIQDKNNAQRNMDHLVVLAKNKSGWSKLMSAVSRSNDADVYYYKPRLDMEMLAEYAGDLIAFSGHLGSRLSSCLFKSGSDEFVSNPVDDACKVALSYQDIFGKGNFFIEIQRICGGPLGNKVADILTEVSKKTGIPRVATADSHYPTRQDAIDQRLIVCSSLKTTFSKVKAAIASDDGFGLDSFFNNDYFHIPSSEEMEKIHTGDELDNTLQIADMCEDYDILGKPRLPKFNCPNGLSQEQYLRELCLKGWQDKLVNRGILDNVATTKKYADRVKHELQTFETAGLAGYFLIVQDYCNWARNQGYFVGPGRGSGAGCLVSYLTGITLVDPIPHDLLFSRFYNAGRNTAERVSFPDIDCDFPITKKDEIITYLKQKYGDDRVCQMVTFSRLQGRGALREVLRVHDVCGYSMLNTITQDIPQEHKIADQMEAVGEKSILRFVLEHDPKAVQDYCRLEDDGTLSGEYAQYFEQAIRIEGTFKSQSKHPAGVIISSDNLNDVCPMVLSKKNEAKIAGLEMNDLEAMGHIKFDVLGVAALDKLQSVNELLRYGHNVRF